MSSTTEGTQINQDEPACYEKVLPELRKKLMTDIEKAEIVLVHFDHIAGESESDRNQIFFDLLKAATYFGLDIEKIDFNRSDP